MITEQGWHEPIKAATMESGKQASEWRGWAGKASDYDDGSTG